MKQVVFAVLLLAMASFTGCLTDDESSVDETTDTTSDNTGNTNDNSNDNTDSGDTQAVEGEGDESQQKKVDDDDEDGGIISVSYTHLTLPTTPYV